MVGRSSAAGVFSDGDAAAGSSDMGSLGPPGYELGLAPCTGRKALSRRPTKAECEIGELQDIGEQDSTRSQRQRYRISFGTEPDYH